MALKWLVSFPLGQHGLAPTAGEDDRSFARRLVQAKQFAEATSVYEHLLRHERLDAALLTNLSLVEFKQGHLQSSARYAEQATCVDRKNGKAWYRLGCALAALGLADRAEACCVEALAVEPGSSAVLELRKSLSSVATPLPVDHELYGALLNEECPGSILPEALWRKILGKCEVSDHAALRLTCSLFNHVAWKLHSGAVTVHAGGKTWRLAHRLPHLQTLKVLVRHSHIAEDWAVVCAETFKGKPLATVFPALERLSIKPTVTGLSRKEIKEIVAKQDRQEFDDEQHLEQHLAGSQDSRLDLNASLGRCAPRMIVKIENMLMPSAVPCNLYGLYAKGNLRNYSSDHFKVLLRSNLFYLKIISCASEQTLGQSYGGGDISGKICEYFPATLEQLAIKNCSGFEFPTSKLPQGLKYLSVRGLYFQHAHCKGLPPLLETMKLDLTMHEDNEKEQFRFESFSLHGLPKRCTRCTVIQPLKKHWKMGRFQLTHTDKLTTTTLIIR